MGYDHDLEDEDFGTVFSVLPLRDMVIFPHMIVPLFVGRDKSIRALEAAKHDGRPVFLVTQKRPEDDEPATNAIYNIGTLANILQLLKFPDGTVKVLVEGVRRGKVVTYTDEAEFYEAEIEFLAEPKEDEVELEALSRSVLEDFENYTKLNSKISAEVLPAVNKIMSASKLSDTIASHLAFKIADKQDMLATISVRERLERILVFMESEISVLQVEKRIRSRVKRQMEKTQREYYLNEQMKAIQKELDEDGQDEIAVIEAQLKALKLSKEAREKAESELKKLRNMAPMTAEATVVRNYLDWFTSLPWQKKSKIKNDLGYAEKVMGDDHYGLEEVKERIIEYLAVQGRSKKLKGPIICLVGPPGVGKTSLAKSIARATGREYVRISLGGVHDEAEIRGHRRTYIGSLPGKIIQSLKKVKKSNPLILLDEIDKLGRDFRGDPSAALLEVLDPAQNSSFVDHYLEVEYDLSDVMFVTTANSLNILGPLMDRMEIIRISGYTEAEKLEIVHRHLLDKALKEHALSSEEFSVSTEAVRHIIQYYTREAGVRNLEREIMKLARKAVTVLAKTEQKCVAVDVDNLETFLGVRRYRYGEMEGVDQVGVVRGLAWTEVGGELLTIEGVMMPGKGKMIVTGNLRDVMKESISAASSYVRSRAVDFGIRPPLFDQRDIHVHVPEGATPKDGPSAGIAMVTAIVSVLTGIPVRRDLAMTGEVTLRGRVLPIGGLKEKLLAAHRAGLATVLIPEENVKDLIDIPDEIKAQIEIIPVTQVSEVLEHALVAKLEAITWPDPSESLPLADKELTRTDNEQSSARAH